MLCTICETRRPRRHCPGVGGEICGPCCGEGREVTVSCPLDCEYLRDARAHDRVPPLDPEQLPNKDIRVPESFLSDNEELFLVLGRALLDVSLRMEGVVDSDAREALDGLVRTYRTLESGLYYDSRPANPLAAAIFGHLQETLEGLRKRHQETGAGAIRDVTVLGILVFLQRLEFQHHNGRRKGRAFIDLLRLNFAESPEPPLVTP